MEGLEGGDISIEHFLQDQRDFRDSSEGGRLQREFKDSCVLLTGVTGLLGSLVLEKLLRSCEGTAKVYVTVREKGGKSAHLRLKELLSSKLFERVRLDHPDRLQKVELLDMAAGLDSHVGLLTSHLTHIVHCGTVSDVTHAIGVCLDANIKQTITLLELAYRSQRLEAFVVVSSTLCHSKERVLEERFYPPPVTAAALSIIVSTFPEHVVKQQTMGLVVNDTTAAEITLAVMEDLLKTSRKSLPLAIIRPSMLVASYKEPLSGWLPNEPRGLMGLLSLAVQGRLCSLRADPALKAEIIPADLAASLVLAVTAHTSKTRRNWENQEVLDDLISNPNQIQTDHDVPIYNLVSSNQSPISWKEFLVCSIRHARNVPILNTVWYPHLVLTKSNFWFTVWFYIMHLIPALAVDGWIEITENPNILNAKRPRLSDKYHGLCRCCEALSPHTLYSQQYQSHNTNTLWRLMCPGDRATFCFNPLHIDWDEYMYTLARGIRLYCLHDSLDTIPRASSRIKRLKLLHYSIVVMSSFLLLMALRVVVKVLLF